MKRKDVLKEFLTAIFGSTTVKPTGNKIYRSGNMFSSCSFDDNDREQYSKLLLIAYLDDNPKQQKPNYGPEDFNREQSISKLYNYLYSYRGDLLLPKADSPSSSIFAFKASVTILTAIFSPSSESDKFKIEDEDISRAFCKALDRIQKLVYDEFIKDIVNLFNNENSILYDKEYDKDHNKCNYSVSVVADDIFNELRDMYQAILLKIYIDKDGKYDKESNFFFTTVTSLLDSDYDMSRNGAKEMFLYKPLSLKGINIDIPEFWRYSTYIDENTILNKYKCNDEYTLKEMIINKAKKQYKEYIDDLKTGWDSDIINYTEDIIKRVMSLDLIWLYTDTEKSNDKCREEIEKIVVGYPEIYSYLDSCSEEVKFKQLSIILHHSVKVITAFINNRCRFVSVCINSPEYSEHKKHVKGIVNGKKFKQLKELSEGMNNDENEEMHSLFDEYYYTSGNELSQLLASLQSYYESLKKVHKES